jgi:hypothetical protein
MRRVFLTEGNAPMHSPSLRRSARLIGIVAALGLFTTACGGDDDDAVEVPAGPQGTESFEDLARDHTTSDVNYPQSPPVGGPHDPAWLNCSVYTDPVRDENAVHSLEHGAVWIAYSEELDEAGVTTLASKAQGDSHVLMSPYPGLSSPVVLTAWGKQLAVDSADDPRIDEFLETFVEGPQTPEPGAPCTGGTM